MDLKAEHFRQWADTEAFDLIKDRLEALNETLRGTLSPNANPVAGIKIAGCLLPSLRHHFCRIRLSRHTSRAELLPLLVVLGLSWLTIVHLRADPDTFLVDLATGLQLPGGGFGGLVSHILVLPASAIGLKSLSAGHRSEAAERRA